MPAQSYILGMGTKFLRLAVAAAVSLATEGPAGPLPPQAPRFYPSGVTLSWSSADLLITCAASNVVLRFDTATRRVVGQMPVPGTLGTLAVSSAKPVTATGSVAEELPASDGAVAPVVSRDGKKVDTCTRFDNSVSAIEVATQTEVWRVPVQREPVAADLTKDGKFLLVANHLLVGRADGGYCGAVVSVVDTSAGKVVKELRLPNGSGSLKDIRVSPDGKYAAVTHLVANFKRPAIRPFPDWMNGNALTVIGIKKLEILGSVLLDDRAKGAANPWGLAWSPDGTILVVAHSGTHEVSVIDFPEFLKRLLDLPAPVDPLKAADPATATQEEMEFGGYVPYFPGPRRRVKLPEGDLGPRAIVVVENTAYTANYFSDTLTAIDLSNTNSTPESIALSRHGSRDPRTEPDPVRKGEFYFHDATICFQGWQSCSSCHPGDARADGLNWDLLNDGLRNPKNTKSLLLAHRTPPAMWLAVRETAETAVRAGIKHILFTSQPEDVASAIDAYLKSLKPVLSPHLVQAKISEAARRGEKVFSRAGCAECHPPPLFTDLHQYNVGTGRRPIDKPADRFDTPTLVEIWRTAPYLHDGSAATVQDVLTVRNPRDRHGKTSTLTPQDLKDLCAFILSL